MMVKSRVVFLKKQLLNYLYSDEGLTSESSVLISFFSTVSNLKIATSRPLPLPPGALTMHEAQNS